MPDRMTNQRRTREMARKRRDRRARRGPVDGVKGTVSYLSRLLCAWMAVILRVLFILVNCP